MLAFCFLTYEDVEHLEVWAPFFAAAAPDQYTIVIHRKEGEGSALPATVIPTQATEWGTWSLVEVQQSLFREAAKNPAVTKFILLSADTIPLYSFAALYKALMADDKGYIRKTTNRQSAKKIPNTAAWSLPWRWSLSSQWIILNRTQFTALEDNFAMLRAVFGTMFIPDEHVYSIFFDGVGLLSTFKLVPPVHVQWDQIHNQRTVHTMMCTPLLRYQRIPEQNRPCSIWHRERPHTFHAEELTARKVVEIYASSAFFLRKVCSLAPLRFDMTRDRILLPKA
jgi:hypothetical protein